MAQWEFPEWLEGPQRAKHLEIPQMSTVTQSFISGPWLTRKSMQVLMRDLQSAPADSTASEQASTSRCGLRATV